MPKENLQPSVLVVEDDSSIVKLLEYNLTQAGYNVRTTDNGEEAFLMIEERKPDLVLLDWMLPEMSGVQVCQKLRSSEKTRNIPIIMISARGEESDKVMGLEGGVDDYLVKPFSPRELLARINAVFRRIRPVFSEKTLEFAGIKMDMAAKTVSYHGENLHLGPTEYKLLQALLEYPKRVLSREQLIRKVWGDEFEVEARTVDVHINRLRKALKVDTKGAVIKTIRSSGYRLQDYDDKDSGE